MKTAPTFDTTQETLCTIGQLYSDAREALRNARTWCERARQLSYHLALPGSSAIHNAFDETRDAIAKAFDPLDTANDALKPLRHHALHGTLAALFAQCQNCTAWNPSECDCEHAAQDDDDTASNAAHPCPNYDPIPPGCNCYRCQHIARLLLQPTCTLDHSAIPCPSAHCCNRYTPASIPADTHPTLNL